jgi:hypothetical protein
MSASAGSRARRAAPSRRPPGVVALPVLAAALVVAAALAGAGGEQARPPRAVPVAATTYACAAAPDVATGQVRPGGGAAARTLPGGAAVEGVVDPGRWVRSDLDDALGGRAQALVVSRTGAGVGAVGFATGVLGDDDGDGLVVGACPGVTDDAWYAGLGSSARHRSELVLTNLGQAQAVVDLTLWTPDGPVDAVGADGLVVEPGESRVVALDDLAAGEPTLGVHVSRRRGAVAVAALDTSTGATQGSELVSPAAAPRRDQVVAGLPQGERGRTLHVLNPGERTAQVRVEALGARGPFVPEGLGDVRVGPGQVATVALPRSVGSGSVALRLTSDVAVVPSVTVSPTGDDVAVLESARAWRGSAVVPLGGGIGVPELVLTAPDADGGAIRLVLEARGADEQVLGTAEVSVPAGTTLAVDPDDDLDLADATSLVVRSEGAVVGSATYRDGDRRAALRLDPAPTTVRAPRVVPAP